MKLTMKTYMCVQRIALGDVQENVSKIYARFSYKCFMQNSYIGSGLKITNVSEL